MKRTLIALILTAVFAIPTAWAAGIDKQAMTDEAAVASWERMALSDACMNGDVSASGSYPSQAAEDKSRASMFYLAN